MLKSLMGFMLATSFILAETSTPPAPKVKEPTLEELRFAAEHSRMEYWQLQAQLLQQVATVDAKREEANTKIKVLTDKCTTVKGNWNGVDLVCTLPPVEAKKDTKESK